MNRNEQRINRAEQVIIERERLADGHLRVVEDPNFFRNAPRLEDLGLLGPAGRERRELGDDEWYGEQQSE